MRRGDNRDVERALARAPRQTRRFGDEILDHLDARREPVAALRPARRDSEQQRNRIGGRAIEPLPRDGLADETSVEIQIARIGGRVAVDIGIDLEIGAELGIAFEEGSVPEGRTDKDHFYIERYRSRLRRDTSHADGPRQAFPDAPQRPAHFRDAVGSPIVRGNNLWVILNYRW